MAALANPWDTDRPLDDAGAAAAIAAAFPELAGRPLERLGSGWDFDAYSVDGEWVVRFPRRAETVATLEREASILPTVAEILSPTGLEVPNPTLRSGPAGGFPYPIAGYRFVPGCSLDRVPADRIDGGAVARELAAALRRLHAADLDAPGLTALPAESDGPAEWLADAVQTADDIAAALPAHLKGVTAPWLAGDVALPPPYPGPLRLVHNDLGPDHVLLDPDTGRVTGLIDWGDAARGDPVVDLVCVGFALEPPFGDRLVEAYGLTLDADARERFVFLSRVESLVWLGESWRVSGARDIARHGTWVDRAFRDTGGAEGARP